MKKYSLLIGFILSANFLSAQEESVIEKVEDATEVVSDTKREIETKAEVFNGSVDSLGVVSPMLKPKKKRQMLKRKQRKSRLRLKKKKQRQKRK